MFVGDKKVGKTSLASQFPDHHILEGEPGNAKHLECSFTDIHDWETAKNAITFLEQNPTFCKTIVIDDVPSFYEYCMMAVRKQLKLAEDEKPGFTGYDVCLRWFNLFIRRIERLPIGKIYTAHTKINEVQTRTKRTISLLEPSWSGQCKKVLDRYTKLTGFIMFGAEGQREMHIIGDDFIQANNGFAKHFLIPGVENKQRNIIPLGTSAIQAYKNVLAAWKNESLPFLPVAKSKKGVTQKQNQKPKTVSLNDLK
jgi:GTPase SAR1 family protein